MSLRNKIPFDMKEALRNKKSLELSVLRMLQSAIKNKEIDNRAELNDEQIIEVISSEVKKRRDAAEEFIKVKRQDAAETENQEIEILMRYMPEQLSEEEISQITIKAVNESGAVGMKDLGKVMKIVMPKLKGKADGTVINKIVRDELQKLE
ncbi:MAG: GatB/YqeY domain-containing protein [Thermodesulfobacteriota bacterium]